MIRFVVGLILLMGGFFGIGIAGSSWNMWMSFVIGILGTVTMIWPLADGSLERQANNG